MFQDYSKPKQVGIVDKYNNLDIVQVSKKYQCPTYCDVNHNHFVYYEDKVDDNLLMTIKKPNYKKLKKIYVVVK